MTAVAVVAEDVTDGVAVIDLDDALAEHHQHHLLHIHAVVAEWEEDDHGHEGVAHQHVDHPDGEGYVHDGGGVEEECDGGCGVGDEDGGQGVNDEWGVGVHWEEDMMDVHYGCGRVRELPKEVDGNCLGQDVTGDYNFVAVAVAVDGTPIA